MIGVFAISLWFYILGAGCVAVGWVMTLRLTPEHKRPQITRWLYEWSGKGLLLPLLIWALMNFGLSWDLQPFMPAVQAAQNSGKGWVPEWLRATATGLCVIGSYWTAGTLGWVLASMSRGLPAEQQKDFRALLLTCSAALAIPALIIWLLGGWSVLGFATGIILVPIAAYSPDIIQPRKAPPMYARAIARIKFGKYREAEWEIIRELEKSEDDFEGWLMLAELYANRFGDLTEAERTIAEICDQPKISPSQVAVALHRLADWKLKAGDPVGARRAMQAIVDRMKGTHLAHMAGLRLNQIPATVEQWRQQQTGKPIPLPALGDTFDRSQPAPSPTDRKLAARSANALVEQLKSNPNDAEAREKLARIFAESLDRADLGMEQLRLLLNMPEQTDSKRAEWLSITAAWSLKYQHDPHTTRRILARIVEEFPATPQAFAARRRLVQLEKEAQKQAGQV